MTISTLSPTAARLPEPPDIIAAKLRVDDLEARGVSFRGTAHDLFGEPRQDSLAFGIHDDWVVLIVSDGIGSCESSHHGSSAAVNAIVAAVESGYLDPEDGARVMDVAADAGLAVADTLQVPSMSVSATLTVAAVERGLQDDGSRHAIIHVVGDSPALILEPSEGTWTYLTSADEGPSNVVRSWVPDRAKEYVSFDIALAPGSVLVLASDGFTTPLGDGTGPLGQDLSRRWALGPRELLPFLIDLSFNAYHDDKTVVALWNPSEKPTTVAPGGSENRAGDADV
jgi:serine/threonine protein phosphatase PrpC